jgi:Zn-dependent protease
MFDSPILAAVVTLVTVIICMTLHEAMHAFTSHWLGDDTAKLEGRLSLNPWRHIDPFLTIALPVLLALAGGPIFGAAKPVPFNPYRVKGGEFGAALVGIAGPLTNLMFAVAGAGVVKLVVGSASPDLIRVLVLFIEVNIGFFVFNMIPFPPLDGSRLLYAFAPEPVQRLMRQVESLGFTGIAIFMFLLFPAVAPLLREIMVNVRNFLLL